MTIKREMSIIPDELHKLKQWSFSYDASNLKRPTHSKYRHNGALTLAEAIKKAGTEYLTGMYVTKKDPYVLMDIDHIDDPNDPFDVLPPKLEGILLEHDTYSEISPSGQGVRVIFRLPSVKDKKLLAGNIFYTIEEMGSKRNAQINVGQPWMTITRNPTEFSDKRISEITLGELAEAFALKYKEVDEPANMPDLSRKVSTIGEFRDAVMALPFDINPRILRAYRATFLAEYTPYDYWLKVLMAIHKYAVETKTMLECFELAVKWSSQDKANFKGIDDIRKRWDSFSGKTNPISHKTVFKLFYSNSLRWPKPKKKKDGDKRRYPITSEYVNFVSLLRFFNIKLYRDEGNINYIYVTGDDDIMLKYFKMHNATKHLDKYYGWFAADTLIPAFHIMLQDFDFMGLSHAMTSGFVKNILAQTRRTVNIYREYFETPFHKLPTKLQEGAEWYDNSTPERLFKCLTLDTDSEKEIELYKSYYKFWLMGMVRSLFFPDSIHMNNCILILTGREQIRKTSHFKYLLPKFMRHRVTFTTHGFQHESSIRDVAKIAANSLVVVWDEIENYLVTGVESAFKKTIDNNPQTIIDKYQTVESIIRPVAIYGGTSNQSKFNLGDEGSRRMFIVPVKWIDTDAMEKICWHRLINDLRATAEAKLKKGEAPWLLTESQLSIQMRIHAGQRNSNSLDIMFDEMFDTDDQISMKNRESLPGIQSFQGYKGDRFMTTRQVVELLDNAGYNTYKYTRAGIVKALERLCGNYTNTRTHRVSLHKPKCTVFKGQAAQGRIKRWVLPPIAADAKRDVFSDLPDEE